MSKDNLNGTLIWGDICCAECCLVLLTVEVNKEGIYEFKKIENLNIKRWWEKL